MEEPGKGPTTTELPLLADVVGSRGSVSTRTGWKFKNRKCGPFTIPYYVSPAFQAILASILIVLGPGMYAILYIVGSNVLNTYDMTYTELFTANSVCAIVISFFAGVIINSAGIRITSLIGSLCYSVFATSYLVYARTQNSGYVIFAWAIMGCCTGLLWPTLVTVILSYPQEGYKGRYIALSMSAYSFWRLIGCIISLRDSITSSTTIDYSDATLISFLVLSILCFGVAWALVDIKSVVRRDGSHLISMHRPSWKTEILGFWEAFGNDFYILLLFPIIFALGHILMYPNILWMTGFTLRATYLNYTLYFVARLLAYLVTGYALDFSRINRARRAKLAWAYMFLLTFAVWGGGYAYQRKLERYYSDTSTSSTSSSSSENTDWTSAGYIGPMFLMMFYGFHSSALETCVYWYVGAMSNNTRTLAYFSGLQLSISSVGEAIAQYVQYDAQNNAQTSLFITSWALTAVGLVFALPVALWRIKDTVPLEEDLNFTDHAAFGDLTDNKDMEFHQDGRASISQPSDLWSQ